MRRLSRWGTALAVGVLLGTPTAILSSPPASARSSPGSGLSERLAAKRAAEAALANAVAADTGRLGQVQGSIGVLERRLAPIQARLAAKQSELAQIHTQLAADRRHLLELEQRLRVADGALARILVAHYEADTPDAVTVILDAKGFADLLERVDFLHRVRNQDSRIILNDRTVRRFVSHEATRLGHLEVAEQRITATILAQRNQIASIRLVLVGRGIAIEKSRSRTSGHLAQIRAERQRLEGQLSRIRAQEAAAAAAARPPSGAVTPTGGVSAGGHVSQGGGFVFPMPSGAAVSPGSWSQDQGVDISAPGHTPLLAVGSGTIVLHGIGGFGPSAPVLHLDDGRYVYYGHAGPGNMLPIGTHVSAGQTISEVGDGIVGISTGPHLEIGFCDASGGPVAGTSASMLALLHGAYGG